MSVKVGGPKVQQSVPKTAEEKEAELQAKIEAKGEKLVEGLRGWYDKQMAAPGVVLEGVTVDEAKRKAESDAVIFTMNIDGVDKTVYHPGASKISNMMEAVAGFGAPVFVAITFGIALLFMTKEDRGDLVRNLGKAPKDLIDMLRHRLSGPMSGPLAGLGVLGKNYGGDLERVHVPRDILDDAISKQTLP